MRTYTCRHWTVEDFNVKFKFANHDTVPYRAHDITCNATYRIPCHVRELPLHWAGVRVHSKVHVHVVWELWLQEVVLLEKTMEFHKREWHFSMRSILSVPALGEFLVMTLVLGRYHTSQHVITAKEYAQWYRIGLQLVVVVVFYYFTRDLPTACGFSQGALDMLIIRHGNQAWRQPAGSQLEASSNGQRQEMMKRKSRIEN